MPEIVHEQAVQLTPLVKRVTAANPGVMTGAGTNTYIVGQNKLAVIDPGPATDEHMQAILDVVGDKLAWILVTHTHGDHSPGAAVLHEKTGAPLYGNEMPDDGFQDTTFTGATTFRNDQQLTADEFTLRVIETPGHVGNHLCFLLEEEGMLFSGDHIMQGSTVVIIPPHGNMKDYLDSHSRLLNYPIQSIAPGHGLLINDPLAEIEGLIQHRLWREQKIIDGLAASGPIAVEDLTSIVYKGSDKRLMIPAQLSLTAHLIKLQSEGRASLENELWQYIDEEHS